jgi:sec-independent protein translocase protein TatA
MGGLSIWHWLLVLGVVLLLFGGGNKLSNVMGDFAKGIKSFKKNMSEETDESMEASAERPTGSIAPPSTNATAKPSPTPVHPS